MKETINDLFPIKFDDQDKQIIIKYIFICLIIINIIYYLEIMNLSYI